MTNAKQKTGIYDTVNQSSFIDAFKRCGRGEQFTYDGLKALYDYLDALSDDIGEPIELDVIALCCEYTEYENLAALRADYPSIEDMDDLESNTVVIPVDGESFIIQQF